LMPNQVGPCHVFADKTPHKVVTIGCGASA
jgi:hypothetical protein